MEKPGQALWKGFKRSFPLGEDCVSWGRTAQRGDGVTSVGQEGQEGRLPGSPCPRYQQKRSNSVLFCLALLAERTQSTAPRTLNSARSVNSSRIIKLGNEISLEQI